jgi:hypothetical protein
MSFAKPFFDSVGSAVGSFVSGVSRFEKSLETSASGKIALLGLFSAMVSPAAASAVVGVALTEAAVGFTLKLNGLKAGHDSVGVALSALPAGVSLSSSMTAFASCLSFNGTVDSSETIPTGTTVYFEQQNGISGSVVTTLTTPGSSFSDLVNGTCAKEMLVEMLSGVTPKPINPGDGAHVAEDVSKLAMTMGAVFAGLVITSVAAGFVGHRREVARVINVEVADAPLLGGPAARPAAVGRFDSDVEMPSLLLGSRT